MKARNEKAGKDKFVDQQREEKARADVEECTFRPAISERSKQLAVEISGSKHIDERNRDFIHKKQ